MFTNNEALEVNIALHCNLRCSGCSHFAPSFHHWVYDVDELARDLASLRKHYRASSIRLLGGEPLLHPDLRGIIAVARDSGVSERVELVTNGTLLALLDTETLSRLDRLELSGYPGVRWKPREVDRVRAAAERLGVEVEIREYTHFRVPVPNPAEASARGSGLTKRIFSTCRVAHRWNCHTLHRGSLYRCPQSAFAPRETMHGREFVDLAGGSPGDALTRLLASDRDPLPDCARCNGTAGRLVEHSQRPWNLTGETVDRLELERAEAELREGALGDEDGCSTTLCAVDGSPGGRAHDD